MRALVSSILVLTLVSGCSRIASSSFNPGNWFGGSSNPVTATAVTEVPPIIPANKAPVPQIEGRALIADLVTVEVRDVSGGVLVTAQGRTARQGAFNLQLVDEGTQGATLRLAFRVQYPASQTAASSQLVTVAQFLTERQLRGVRTIQVRGADQAISRSN